MTPKPQTSRLFKQIDPATNRPVFFQSKYPNTNTCSFNAIDDDDDDHVSLITVENSPGTIVLSSLY
jgi:hypothetical protein